VEVGWNQASVSGVVVAQLAEEVSLKYLQFFSVIQV